MATNPYTRCNQNVVYSRVDVYTLFQNLMNTLGNSTYFGTGFPNSVLNIQLVDTDIYKWYVDTASGSVYNYHNGAWFPASTLGLGSGGTQTPQVLGYNAGTGTISLSNGGGAITITMPPILSKHVEFIGNGVTLSVTINDGIAQDKSVVVRDVATNTIQNNLNIKVLVGTTVVTFPTVPALNSYRITVIG